MPCYVLIQGVTNGRWVKGFPIDVYDGSRDFSNWSHPTQVMLDISDASKSEVQHYLDSWRNAFKFSIVAQNAQGYRVRFSVNTRVISKFGFDAGIKQDIVSLLVDDHQATVVNTSMDRAFAVFDIPKPANLQAIKNRIMDEFEQELDVRKYYFSDADVDLIFASGGRLAVTKAQVAAKVKNRLTDEW